MSVKKCQYPEGFEVKIGGLIDVDPCVYTVVEKHQNCTVEIVKCVNCGYETVNWKINKEEKGDITRPLIRDDRYYLDGLREFDEDDEDVDLDFYDDDKKKTPET